MAPPGQIDLDQINIIPAMLGIQRVAGDGSLNISLFALGIGQIQALLQQQTSQSLLLVLRMGS
jgi:hypothetical protein